MLRQGFEPDPDGPGRSLLAVTPLAIEALSASNRSLPGLRLIGFKSLNPSATRDYTTRFSEAYQQVT